MAIRWACVGLGGIASDFFTAIRRNLPLDEHDFVAVGSSGLERAKAFAEKFQFKRAYDSYDEVANDDEVEVVYISTYNRDHFRLSIMMLKAGKHVLCEKPMALNEKQVREVFQTAKECKRFFCEGMWSRFMPLYDVVRQELIKTTVGEVNIVRAELMFPIKPDHPTYQSMENRGGVQICLGIYPVQLATLVFNEMPEKIVALGNKVQSGVDQKISAILQYKSGALASLTYGFNTVLGGQAIIYGSKGFIEVGSPINSPSKVTTASGEFEDPVKTNEGYSFINSERLFHEAASVKDSIRKGELESKYWTMDDTVLVYRIMDEIRQQVGVKYPEDEF